MARPPTPHLFWSNNQTVCLPKPTSVSISKNTQIHDISPPSYGNDRTGHSLFFPNLHNLFSLKINLKSVDTVCILACRISILNLHPRQYHVDSYQIWIKCLSPQYELFIAHHRSCNSSLSPRWIQSICHTSLDTESSYTQQCSCED